MWLGPFRAWRSRLVRGPGASEGDFALRSSSFTRRSNSMFVAASSRPRRWISAFQDARKFGTCFSQGTVSARYLPGTFSEAEYWINSSRCRIIFDIIESILWPYTMLKTTLAVNRSITLRRNSVGREVHRTVLPPWLLEQVCTVEVPMNSAFDAAFVAGVATLCRMAVPRSPHCPSAVRPSPRIVAGN